MDRDGSPDLSWEEDTIRQRLLRVISRACLGVSRLEEAPPTRGIYP